MTRRQDGLWFTENYVLIPPRPSIHNACITPPICSFIGPKTSPPPPLHSHRISKMNITAPQAPLSTALKQLELWNQQMGHPSLRTLRHTQRVIEGIPHLPDVEAIFSCRSVITQNFGNITAGDHPLAKPSYQEHRFIRILVSSEDPRI